MPTAAKLFAAFALAIVALAVAQAFKQHMPEGTQFGYFLPVSGLIGALAGWRILGPDTGRGYIEAVNAGVKAAVIMVLMAVFVFSIEQMVEAAFRKSYDGPMEAVIGAIGIGVDFVEMMFVPDVVVMLLLGGIVAGLFSEWAARRWR